MNKWIFKTVVGMNSQPSVVIGVYYEVDKSYGVVLHFYREGDVIEIESAEQRGQEILDDKDMTVWSSNNIQGDMFNLIKELKNNGLIGADTIYLNPKDRNIVSVYDALELYGMLKDKRTKSSGKIVFSSNDELAALLGFRDSAQLEQLMDTSLCGSEVDKEISQEHRQILYDAKGSRCDRKDAVICFTVEDKKCYVSTTNKNLVNMTNIESDKGVYIVFICGIESVNKVGSDLLLHTDDGYRIYISADSFVECMESRDYCYLNKIEGWQDIYGFAVSSSFILDGFESNSERVATMYNMLNLENDWSLCVQKEKPLITVKTILRNYMSI